MPSSSKTKQLAKKLGLIKKGSDLVAGRNGNGKRRRMQIFSHVIILDFESTCWKDRKGPQEIIEFPCVLVDVTTGRTIDEFQQYVQPQERPVLSSFCTELTGIKQEQVDQGVPLPTCLMLFQKWINKMEDSHGFNMATPGQDYTKHEGNLGMLATWTDWDLDVCFKYECQRKRIKKPAFFSHWIDLKATYKNFYERKPVGLKGALLDLGIEFKGREHCGLDDARNTAVLCIRLINDGCLLKVTKSIQALEPITNTTATRPCQLPKKNPSSIPPPSLLASHTSSADTPLASSLASHTPSTNKPSVLSLASHTSSTNKPSDSSVASHTPSTSGTSSAIPTSDIDRGINDPINAFNMSTGAWLDITIPDLEPLLGKYDSVTSKATPTSIDTPTSRQFDKENCLIENISDPKLLIPKTLNLQRFNSISPFPPPSSNQTSTPIPINHHGNSKTLVGGGANSSSSLFKTPSSSGSLSLNGSSFTGRVTPPLCKCGKRTKRKIVHTEGPNEGRPFYSCCLSRQKGCGYFKWETSLLKKFYDDCTPELLTSEYD